MRKRPYHRYLSLLQADVCVVGSGSPVSGERGEREHGHSHRRQLDKRDQFAAHAAKNPLIHQVTAGVYRGAGDQEQQVTQSQTGEEQVGHRPQGPHRQTRLHQSYISHQTHRNNESVDSRDSDTGDPDSIRRWVRCGVASPPGVIHNPVVLWL